MCFDQKNLGIRWEEESGAIWSDFGAAVASTETPGHLSQQCSSYTDLRSAHYCLIQNDLKHAQPKTDSSRAAH